MEQTRKKASAGIILAFYAAVIGGAGHLASTITQQPAMNDAAIEAGYQAMNLHANDSRNGGIMVTTRNLFSTAATVDAYILDQSKNLKLCKYEGSTYQLFGHPLFSTTKSLSCAPAAPWPKLPPKP